MRDGFAKDLLAWYDLAARGLPWRMPPERSRAGERPDPYRVWLSEVMLQQTTVAAVKAYFTRFTTLWPRVEDLAQAEDAAVMAEWAGLGYYARARNLLATARAVTALGGFPETEAGLRALPGIGPYTAAAIASIAFGRAAVVVDGNVERVSARIYAIETPLPAVKPDLAAAAARLTPAARHGDFAQAMMDLGATICTPRNPACVICPVRLHCAAAAQGIAAELPRKSPKPVKPTRFGTAYVLRRADGALLLERRPDRGLLGGMLGWPGGDWAETAPAALPPAEALWTPLNAEVCHTFTHFHLRLSVQIGRAPLDLLPTQGRFETGFNPGDLPTIMRKVWDLAAPHLA